MKGLNELLGKSGVRREAKAEPQEMLSHSSAREVRQPEELGVGRVFFGDRMVSAGIRTRGRSFTINLQSPIKNNHRT